MKMSMIIIFIFLFSSIKVDAQQQDSLVQLYNGMGDTLDFIDREMFVCMLELKVLNMLSYLVETKSFSFQK